MAKRYLIGLILSLTLMAAAGVRANDFAARYAEAEAAYYAKNFDLAESLLKDLSVARGDNSYLNYDLGNVYFKKGDLGRAIQHYEKARLLLPRFTDLQTNLGIARQRIPQTAEESFSVYLMRTFYFWNATVSEPEFALGFSLLTILFWVTIFARWKGGHLLSAAVGTFFLVYAYVTVGFYLKHDAERPGAFGVVLVPKTEAKASYLEKDQALFFLDVGVKVKIVDRQDFGSGQNWLRLQLPQGQKGWVPAASIGII